MFPVFIYFSLIIVQGFFVRGYTVEELRCEVCKSLVSEAENIIHNAGTTALAKVGSHRLDEKGNLLSTVIPLIQSETFLIEVLDSACIRMQDYARGYDKKTRKLRVVKMKVGEKLSPEMSEINPISDSDLNESLRYHCEDIADEHEYALLKVLKMRASDPVTKLCIEEIGLCEPLMKHNSEL